MTEPQTLQNRNFLAYLSEQGQQFETLHKLVNDLSHRLDGLTAQLSTLNRQVAALTNADLNPDGDPARSADDPSRN